MAESFNPEPQPHSDLPSLPDQPSPPTLLDLLEQPTIIPEVRATTLEGKAIVDIAATSKLKSPALKAAFAKYAQGLIDKIEEK